MDGYKTDCFDCGKPEVYGSEETGSVESECICESKRVTCDCCGHNFLQKDMSMNNMFLALCKVCDGPELHLMDNMAVSRFDKAHRPAAMLCVQPIGDKLQLTMRAYHLGVSIIFPAMTKQEIGFRWTFGSKDPSKETPESDFLFDAAVLRMLGEYIGRAELITIRRELIEQNTGLPQGGVQAAC
ncbi:hypothetical protein [Paenibacillus gansuensis]|uniref:Uncharacterized protein n=1 Tax=Paenibacillus gansuensis TaxID=306542 RepID=A0ABW5PHA8_9BACL